jgi:hypothetical protein
MARQAATLSRPASRSATWREPTRGGGWRQLNQPIIWYAVLFLVAVAISWTAARLIWRAPSQPVSSADYVAVVAQMYQHDHNLTIARERLALFGDPNQLAQTAVQASRQGSLKTPADQTAVQALAQALTNGAGAAGSTAGPATPASSAAGTATGDGDQPSWIGPVLAFVLALALGGVVLFRTAGLSLANLQLPSLAFPRGAEPTTEAEPARPTRPNNSLPPRRPYRPVTNDVANPEPLDDDDPFDEDGAEGVRFVTDNGRASAAPVERLESPTGTRVPRPTARPATRSGEALVFQSTYRRGDDPFDEIHPVLDPTSGSLVAACGLNSTLKYDSGKTARWYAFTAWVQDYARDEQLFATGLVAPGAIDAQQEEIDTWVERGQVDVVLPAERGATTRVGDDDLSATITVVNVEYGREGRGQAADIAQLTVKFEVHTTI